MFPNWLQGKGLYPNWLLSDVTVEEEITIGGTVGNRRNKINKDDKIVLQMILKCATIIFSNSYGDNCASRYKMQVREAPW